MKLNKEARRISKDIFKASFVDGKIDEARVRLIVAKMLEKQPRNCASILKDYVHKLKLEADKSLAVVESSVALDANQAQQLETELRSQHGDELRVEFKVNPELLGGVRVRIGSNVWDGSVRDRLNRLAQSL